MRILNRTITLDYLVIFLSALGMITFVMTVGMLVKAIDLMSKGISPMLIAQFFLQNIPYILSFSMPISTLFAALILFGRLSMDNEISAMKACGLSLWRVVAPLILLSILFSGICVYINSEVAPNARHKGKQLLRSAGVEEPINLLEEGRFISDFPGLMIYIGRKNGNVVKDIVAYELNEDGSTKRSVRAAEGLIEPNNETRELAVTLNDVRMEMPDPEDPQDISKTTYLSAESYPLVLDFNEILGSNDSGRKMRKRSYMTMTQLIDQSRNIDRDFPQLNDEEKRIQQSKIRIEANRRISLAMACFTFMLIGIPLGVKSHRKETSIGMVVSLGIVFFYYIFIVIAKALAEYPELHPNLVLWVPLIAMQALGFWLIHRSS